MEEKKEYYVSLPVNAKVHVTVEANSEEEAIEKALSEVSFTLECKNEKDSEKHYEIEEWDVYDKMMEGNFWYGVIYKAEAEQSDW